MNDQPVVRTTDPTRASASRLYNYFLHLYYRQPRGHFYGVDAAVGQRVFEQCPFIPDLAYDNRMFLERAVRHMARSARVQQFVDFGCGIPASEHIHEIVGKEDPDARTLYVDIDEDALTVMRRTVEDEPNAQVLAGDIRFPGYILTHPETTRLIDFTEPVALIFGSSLPFIRDPYEAVRLCVDHLSPGSYVALSHACLDEASPAVREQIAGIAEIYEEAGISATLRTRAEVASFFEGLDLIEPYVTFACDWRPAEPMGAEYPARACNYAAVGRKP
jgi:hypothetical protein